MTGDITPSSAAPAESKKWLDKAADASSPLMLRGVAGGALATILASIFRSFDDAYEPVLMWACVALGIFSIFVIAAGIVIGPRDKA